MSRNPSGGSGASHRIRLFITAIVVGSFGVSCASSRMRDSETDNLFRQQRYDEAAERLRKGLAEETEEGRDGLLYLMDLGLSLHSAGKFDESTKVFLRAADLAEIKDYTSLATESATLLTSDQIKQYKGEDFENVLINVYLALNFACVGNTESALIEARRVNRKLYMMNTEGKRKYKQNAFAYYLAGVLYEANGDWDDAYIDYKKTAELVPGFTAIGEDLWRMAFRMRHEYDLEKIEKKYKLTKEQKDRARKMVAKDRPGEIVVIFQNGISPKKAPDPGFHSIPKFYPRNNPVAVGRVSVTGAQAPVAQQSTQILHDVESTAIQNLEEKWGGILAKKIGGAVAKEVIGNAVASKTDNQALGALLKLALYAADQADTRSWNLLPKDFQVARVPVPGGTYTVKLEPVGMVALPEKTVQVKAGQKVFVTFRYMP